MALMIMPLVQTRALQLLCAVSQHAGQQQLQLNPGGIFNVLRRSSHHQASLPLERLQQAVTPQVCAELAARGYAVVDNVFGAQTVQQLKQELLSVHRQGLMHLNHTHLVSKGSTKLLPKSQIWEAELTLDPAIQQAAPLIAQLNADRSLATMLSLGLPQLRLESQAIKMQHNEGGGGCFPMHFDSDALLDGRRVTAIIYLNDNWHPDGAYGGQLRLYPFPAPPLDIAPLADRMVLFASTSMLHRVLPSHQPRSCFTIWLSEGERRAHSAAVVGAGTMGSPPPPAAADDTAVWQFLMQPAVRQHVCKMVYADEWEQSIRDSHPANAETEAALATHRQEVGQIRTALQKYSKHIEQLAAAANTLTDSPGSSTKEAAAGAVAPSEADVQQALDTLRSAAAHVKWF